MLDPEAPVTDPSDFFGHAGLVRRIFSRIGAERPQSVAVIGGKKSGKTSLLAYISAESVKERFLEDMGRFVFVPVCSGGAMSRDPDSFLAGLEGLLPMPAGGGNPYERVKKTIDGLHAAGKRVVILLDDFHYITQNKLFPLEFFSFLRSMANNYNLAYVTTSFVELQRLCAVKDVQESPFFNIFTNLAIGMLAREEAEALFVKLTGVDEALSQKVVAWCGSSPYLVKLVASQFSTEAHPEALDDAGFQRVLLPAAAPYFHQIVSLLPKEAFKPLQAVSRGKAIGQSELHHVSSLIKQGFLVEHDGEVACFSPAFLAFLRTGLTEGMLSGIE